MEKDLTVVVPTYNRKVLLKNCLLSLLGQTYPGPNYEVIVVDDGSTDGTLNLLSQYQAAYPRLKVFPQRHQGVIRARNFGIQKAKGKIIAFTDDDCLPEKDWLKQLVLTFRKNPQAKGIEGKTLTDMKKVTPFTSQIINTTGGGYQSCNIAYRKEILKKINGFDQGFFYPHGEDVDLALRVLQHGPIIFAPKVVVFHPPRPSGLIAELARVKRITAELRLFAKHPDYFFQKYGHRHIFLQVIFKNSIWIRLFHLKLQISWIRKNPYFYFKFLVRTFLEITYIFFLLPQFWYSYQQFKQGE